MPTKIFIYACVLLGIQDSYSQPNLQWATIFNCGPGSQEMGYDIKVDGNLNFYVTGYSRLYQQNYNFITIKYNSSGDTLWTKRYNAYYCIGGYDNGGWTIDVDASGGVYVGGGASVLKYDASGNFLWKHDTLPTVKLIIYNNQYVYT